MNANLVVTFVSGFLFSMGLVISQMIDPNKVIGFLDITGNWDPSLAFVMMGAYLVNIPMFYFIHKKGRPLIEKKFFTNPSQKLDKKLIAGAAIFGLGWGISGICPGPAIANVVNLQNHFLLFFIAMLVGMLIYQIFNDKVLLKSK